MQDYIRLYQSLVVLDPYKEIFISKVCLEVTDPIKCMLNLSCLHSSKNKYYHEVKNVWQKLLVGNQGLL